MRETSKGGIVKVQDGRRGNEKMQLGWPETAAKEVRSQQLASNFSRLSLSHPPDSLSLSLSLACALPSFVAPPLFLYPMEQTCASNAVVL